MRIAVLAAAICLSALAGCEQSYSSSRTVTESNGDVVERTVEVQIGDRRTPPAAEKAGNPPAAPAAPAAADTPVAPEG
ncbi:MAG TPA: hypothetical protein VF686_04695 [Brevundimonas sp.]|jgi:hypothetical protein